MAPQFCVLFFRRFFFTTKHKSGRAFFLPNSALICHFLGRECLKPLQFSSVLLIFSGNYCFIRLQFFGPSYFVVVGVVAHRLDIDQLSGKRSTDRVRTRTPIQWTSEWTEETKTNKTSHPIIKPIKQTSRPTKQTNHPANQATNQTKSSNALLNPNEPKIHTDEPSYTTNQPNNQQANQPTSNPKRANQPHWANQPQRANQPTSSKPKRANQSQRANQPTSKPANQNEPTNHNEQTNQRANQPKRAKKQPTNEPNSRNQLTHKKKNSRQAGPTTPIFWNSWKYPTKTRQLCQLTSRWDCAFVR